MKVRSTKLTTGSFSRSGAKRSLLPRWVWMKSQPMWAWKRPRMAPLQPWPWSTWGLCGSPSWSEKVWCLRWSATQEMTGPSIAAEPRIASRPCSQVWVLKLRWVKWRWKPTVIPSPVMKYIPRKRKTSLQCSALPQTCQPAKPIATNGTRVTRPVMIRSRVSFSTGCMSEGNGPVPLAIRAAIIRVGDEACLGMSRYRRNRRLCRVRDDGLLQHRPAAPRDRIAAPRAPLRGRVLGRDADPIDRRRRPRLQRPLAGARSPTR